MVENTDRMIDLFDRYGARLTIMADVAEIQCFKRHLDETGRDEFAYDAIVKQLRRVVATGHDVQLHIHPSYYNAEWRDGRWRQDYASYDLTRLGYERLSAIIGRGKQFLESALRPTNPSYTCSVFRAANWSMQPSGDIVRALTSNGIRIDTSVFKYGRRNGLVRFDYKDAWSDVVPWPASERDVCLRDPASSLLEVPIYAEPRWIGAFLNWQRLYRVAQSRLHSLGNDLETSSQRSRFSRIWELLGKHAWKLDFNQCTGRELIGGLRRAEVKTRDANCDLPVVLIAHSKLFTRANARSVEPLLQFVVENGTRFRFGMFADVDEAGIRRRFHSGSELVSQTRRQV